MTDDPENQYWYNLKSGRVEHGLQSPSADRVGPFATHSEAAHALETLRENAARWEAEEQRED